MSSSTALDRMKSSAVAKLDGNYWFDDLFIDNCLMVKQLIDVALTPDGRGGTWVIDGGVHVSARLSPMKVKNVKNGKLFKYEFLGPTWRMNVDAVFVGDKLNHRKSIIRWVSDHGELQRDDKGQTARKEVNEWLRGLRE